MTKRQFTCTSWLFQLDNLIKMVVNVVLLSHGFIKAQNELNHDPNSYKSHAIPFITFQFTQNSWDSQSPLLKLKHFYVLSLHQYVSQFTLYLIKFVNEFEQMYHGKSGQPPNEQ
jgi:hypothetical protein